MVLPLPYFTGLGKFILLKSTSPSCLGELMLNSEPESCVDLAGLGLDFAFQARRHLSQNFAIDLDPGLLHARQHRHQRQINFFV